MYGVLVDISTIFFPQIMSSQCQEMHVSWSWPDGTLVTVGVTFTLKPARRPPNSISQHAVNRRFAMPQKMVEFSCVIHVSFMELTSLTWHLATGNCHSFFFPRLSTTFGRCPSQNPISPGPWCPMDPTMDPTIGTSSDAWPWTTAWWFSKTCFNWKMMEFVNGKDYPMDYPMDNPIYCGK